MITADDLQGHWARDWIRAPGFFDDGTRVHWLQAGALYADIRVPARRPALPGTCLAQAGPQALHALMEAEAFAGRITVADGICTWHRHVNWHGAPDGIDAGAMHFEDGALMEVGLHATYTERWVQRGSGLQARAVTGGDMEGVLVEDDTRFLLVMGRPDAPATAPLRAALAQGHLPGGLGAHFGQVCALGHWQGPDGIATLALDPFAEGTAVLRRGPDGPTARWPGFDGKLRDYALSHSDR